MSDLGFWNLATQHPDHIALVTPAGTRVRAGDLLVRSNQLVHGLRQLGLAQGDVVATLLPNGAEMIEMYLAATQAGFYLVPINHHLAAPEIAYIVGDCDAKALFACAETGEVCARAADSINFPALARFATAATPGMAARASASSMVRVVAEPAAPRVPKLVKLPGLTVSRLVPRPSSWLVMPLVAPCPTATRATPNMSAPACSRARPTVAAPWP